MEKITGTRKIKDKNLIIVDRDTYNKLLEVYKKPHKIPHYERIRIFDTRAEINKKGGEKKK